MGAIVVFNTIEEAHKAFMLFHNSWMEGCVKPIQVQICKAKERTVNHLRKLMEKDKHLRQILVYNFSAEVDEPKLCSIFSCCGIIKHIHIFHKVGASLRHAIIVFAKQAHAKTAIEEMNESFTVEGCKEPIKVTDW